MRKFVEEIYFNCSVICSEPKMITIEENGINCPFNSINVGVNLFTGEIVNYSYWWIDVELPSPDNNARI